MNKMIGFTWCSSRYSGKVRVGFAGRSATEKPIPLSLQAEAQQPCEAAAQLRKAQRGFADTRQWPRNYTSVE